MKPPIVILDSVCKPLIGQWSRRILYGALLVAWKSFADELQKGLQFDTSGCWTEHATEFLIATLAYLIIKFCCDIQEPPIGPQGTRKSLAGYLLGMTFQVCYLVVPSIVVDESLRAAAADSLWTQWLHHKAEAVCELCRGWLGD
eukprot:Gregarina_sp_Poly_1__3346@NODE_1965_length_2981_cov_52_021277_g1265_i0_p3_GENE_NODE_1965_length_2981_cov_52_021277_g1265_i0NODE_1965_length_2981_cov_52_021277_g1265_i0_p3_ORF_typecomplete_len144_score14_51_NODE_1965_length_2981_cov_52_021277_g1265_i024472878